MKVLITGSSGLIGRWIGQRLDAEGVEDLVNSLSRLWCERQSWLKRRNEISGWTKRNYSFEAMRNAFVEAIDQL